MSWDMRPDGPNWAGHGHLGEVRGVEFTEDGVPVASVITYDGAYFSGCRVVGPTKDGLAPDVGDQVLLVHPPGRGGAPFVVALFPVAPPEGVLEEAWEPARENIPARRSRRDVVFSRDGARVVLGEGGWLALDTVRSGQDIHVQLPENGVLRISRAHVEGGEYVSQAPADEQLLLGKAWQDYTRAELVDKLNGLAAQVQRLEATLAQVAAALGSGPPEAAVPAAATALQAHVGLVWEEAQGPGEETLASSVLLPSK